MTRAPWRKSLRRRPSIRSCVADVGLPHAPRVNGTQQELGFRLRPADDALGCSRNHGTGWEPYASRGHSCHPSGLQARARTPSPMEREVGIMKRLLLAFVVLAAALSVMPMGASAQNIPGLKIAFNDCGGPAEFTWTCAVNTGNAFTAIASVVIDASSPLQHVTGEESTVEIAFQTPVPEWWKSGTGILPRGQRGDGGVQRWRVRVHRLLRFRERDRGQQLVPDRSRRRRRRSERPDRREPRPHPGAVGGGLQRRDRDAAAEYQRRGLPVQQSRSARPSRPAPVSAPAAAIRPASC